jgi:DeoR/GlpR family transcriptional regulator of sugar metabolism
MNILKDKYNLLKEQSKQAQIPDIEKLTARQQRIYQYLLDYKFLQNSQFMLLFPEISEDSILRDLKVLIDKNLIIKSGKTKSSKYELKH